MQNSDNSSSPYYNAYPNPNPNLVEPISHAPTSYASAPPYSSTPYAAPPPPSPTAGNYGPPNYPSVPHNTTDHVLPAPSSYSQPQSAYSFPQFESHGTHPPQSQTQSQPSYYPMYDHQVNYAPNPNPSPRPPESNYVPHLQQLQLNSTGYDANYDAYDPNLTRARSDLGSQLYGKRDQTGYNNNNSYGSEGLYGDNRNLSRATSDLGSELYGKRDQSGYNYTGNYGSESPYTDNKILSRGRSDLGSELYGKHDQIGYNYNSNYGSEKSFLGDNDGVYAYKGSSEPYGARGTAPKSSTWSGFDDFGRPIGYSSSSSTKEGSSLGSGLKVVRAVPKAETTQDAKGGVQKFRVKLLAESAGQETMDVLCQIALDGIRMLDPSTSRTLRIYLLDTITRCEAIDSSIFAFWSKTPVDIEARRIRLKSNSYTTSTLLDTVTAAIAQYKEMSARSRPQEYPKVAEQPTEKKKGFADFMNLIKQVNEEKDHWVPDEAISKCTSCGTDFSAFVRKHHCRNCGDIFCDKCTQGRTALTAEDKAPVVRVCDRCLGEVTRRLNTAKVAANRPSVVESHEDLAKKLQEELEKSCKISSGSKSNSSGKRMKEVACPTCTVHLQVQVPSSGSETIECGVCQHPFLVTGY